MQTVPAISLKDTFLIKQERTILSSLHNPSPRVYNYTNLHGQIHVKAMKTSGDRIFAIAQISAKSQDGLPLISDSLWIKIDSHAQKSRAEKYRIVLAKEQKPPSKKWKSSLLVLLIRVNVMPFQYFLQLKELYSDDREAI